MHQGRGRFVAALGIAALVLTGCTDGAGTGDDPAGDDRSAARSGEAQTGTGFLDPATAEETFDTLIATAERDEFVHLGIAPNGIAILVSDDPTADTSGMTGYRLEPNSDEVITEPLPNPMPNPAEPMTAEEVDLPMVLGLAAPCDEPTVMVSNVGRSMRTVTKACADDGSDVMAYWLDGTPINFRVDDAASVTDMVNRITEGSGGEITGLMLIQNGTATSGDGSERRYSNLQLGVVETPERVLDYMVEEPGSMYANAREHTADTPTMRVDELDVEGLLACAVELRAQGGLDGGSVYVSRSTGGDRIEYEFRDPNGEGGLTTDTDCNPM